MKRVLSAITLLALVSTACNGVSRIDSSAQVVISGQVVRQDGSPAADLPVAMSKELGPAEAFEAMFTVFSFGTVCLVVDPPDICRERGAIGRTDSNGAFRLDVSGRDTQSFFGFASTLAVSAALPRDGGAGPSTTLRFAAQAEQIDLPPLRLWEAIPKVADEGGAISVMWPQTPGELGRPDAVRVVFENATGAGVWAEVAPGAPVRIDPRLLEDFATGVVVQAENKARVSNLTVDAAYRTAQAAVRGAGPAPSRGRSCTLDFAGEKTVLSPCALTDGDITKMLTPPFGAGGPPATGPGAGFEAGNTGDGENDSIVIDLGDVAARSLAVLRGDPVQFSIELSRNGVNWSTPITVQGEGPALAAMLGDTPARYVRLRSIFGPVLRLTELSIW